MASFKWPPSSSGGGGGGVDTVGNLDSQARNARGLTISGTTLSTQSADATHPGMLTAGTQTIAGAKTLTGNLTVGSNLIYSLFSGNTGSGDITFPSGKTVVRATTNTFINTISNTGIADGTSVYLINSTSGSIDIKNNATPSAGYAPIITGMNTSAEFLLPLNCGAHFIYSSAATAWFIVSINIGTIPYIANDVYPPTIVNLLNVSASSVVNTNLKSQITYIDNSDRTSSIGITTVTGTFSIDPTATGLTKLQFSLPDFPSAVNPLVSLSGVGVGASSTAYQSGIIYGVNNSGITDAIYEFFANDVTARNHSITLTYQED